MERQDTGLRELDREAQAIWALRTEKHLSGPAAQPYQSTAWRKGQSCRLGLDR